MGVAVMLDKLDRTDYYQTSDSRTYSYQTSNRHGLAEARVVAAAAGLCASGSSRMTNCRMTWIAFTTK